MVKWLNTVKSLADFFFVNDFSVVTVFAFAFMFTGFSNSVNAETSDEFIKKAQHYIEQSQYKAAIIELKNAIQKDQKNAVARLKLGEVYLKVGDGRNAENELTRAHLLKIDYNKIALPLAKAYTLQRKNKQVLAIKINKDLPADIKAKIRVLYAQAYINTKNLKKAKVQLQEALKVDKTSAEALLALAQLSMLEKNIETAHNYVKKVLNKNPDNSDAWTLEGEIARLQGDKNTAKSSFEKALSLNPNNIQAMLGASNVYIMSNEMDKAMVLVNKILKKQPKHTMANYYFALAHYRNGDLTKSDQALRLALKTNPDHMPSQQLMGAIQYQTGRIEQAEYFLSKVIIAQPANLGAAKLLAAVRLKNNRGKKVIEILAPLLGRYSQDPQLLALIGSAYVQIDQPNKGIIYLQKSVELDPKSANALTQLAMAHLNSGEDNKAVEVLENAIKLEQGVLQADILLTLTYLRNQEYEKALKQTQQIDKENFNTPVIKNLSGAAYLGLKKYDKARQLFNETLKLDPTFTTASMNLARVEEAEKNFSGAIKIYENLIKKNRKQIDAYIALARVLESQGDLNKAVDVIKKANLDNPRNPVVGLYLINYYIGEGFSEKALELAKQIKRHNVNNTTVNRAYGMALVNAKQYQEAVTVFKQLVNKLPDLSDTHYLLSNAYLKNNQIKLARSHAEKSLKLEKKNLAANIIMAELELKSNNSGNALKISSKLQKYYPKRSDGFILEGDIYRSGKKYKQAADSYRMALNVNPQPEIVLKLAYVYRQQGEESSRRQLLNDWIQKHPKDVKVNLFVANEYFATNELDAAKRIYEATLDIDSDNVSALNNLALIYDTQKNQKALDYARKAYELNSESPQITDTYGWMLVKNGQLDKGLVLLQQAALKAPYLYDISYHLAFALHKSGRTDEAKRELKRVLAENTSFSEAKNAQKLLDSL